MRIEKLVEQHNEMWDAYKKWNERLNLKKAKYNLGDYIRTEDGVICIGRIFFNEGEVYYSKDGISLEGVPNNWDGWYKENDVEPYEPKDGEYCYVKTKIKSEFIFIKNCGTALTSKYISLDINESNKHFALGFCESCTADAYITELRPATPEEKQLLDDKLKEQGKRWNAEKKQIEDLPKEPQIGDMCIFWNDDKEYAVCALYRGAKHDYFVDTRRTMWNNCIPFESVEQYKNFIENGN